MAIVGSVGIGDRGNGRLIVESVAFGLGYIAVLIWSGTALVASFSDSLSFPYWPAIPELRTDTVGFIAFAVAIISLPISKYLQLRRGSGTPAQPMARSSRVLAVQAMADTAVFLGTGLVIYLSLNAVPSDLPGPPSPVRSPAVATTRGVPAGTLRRSDRTPRSGIASTNRHRRRLKPQVRADRPAAQDHQADGRCLHRPPVRVHDPAPCEDGLARGHFVEPGPPARRRS